MRLVHQYCYIEDKVDGNEILRKIERAGRTCYRSEDLITDLSAVEFVKGLIRRGHESVLEHEKVTVRIICDRGVSHELVRHRIASYSQESTRYCSYDKNKFGGEIKYIEPVDFVFDQDDIVLLQLIEKHYLKKIGQGRSPQQARYFLPNGLKTEVVVTMNLREWRHFFKLRTSKAAHPQMRGLAMGLLQDFKDLIPVVFDDIEVK